MPFCQKSHAITTLEKRRYKGSTPAASIRLACASRTARSWQAVHNCAGRVECPERAKRVERRPPSPSTLNALDDDDIVVVGAVVYILRCADNSLYIGETDDLVLRVARHDGGRGCVFTARRRPVTLVYSEVVANREDAMRRERQLKRWTRAKKEALIVGDLAELKRL